MDPMFEPANIFTINFCVLNPTNLGNLSVTLDVYFLNPPPKKKQSYILEKYKPSKKISTFYHKVKY